MNMLSHLTNLGDSMLLQYIVRLSNALPPGFHPSLKARVLSSILVQRIPDTAELEDMSSMGLWSS